MSSEFTQILLVHVVMVLLHHKTFVVSFDNEPQVPCYFIFGDSLVDSGNNNQLVTKFKVNYPPYGIDFPDGETGRFTNGRTSADIIGQHLGFSKFIPTYATATDEQISTGVNYASGGAGIRKESGSHLGERINLDKQLRHHKSVVSRIARRHKDIQFLKKCIYIFNIGSNDYMNNYILHDHYNTSRRYTIDQYAKALIQQYSRQLKTLYKMGGRKIALFGLSKIGCSPSHIYKYGTTTGEPCVEWINNMLTLFNDRLKPLVDELNSIYLDSRFTFINLTHILKPFGDLALSDIPCCQLREDWQCVQNTVPCPIRAMTIFFDGYHPTEISNMFMATKSYVRFSPEDASPYDISQLARL